ncbi:MAG: hypothetical protein GY714_08585 [Desulfobacterales bacterium]|nr:hypothetical protein [Desulfobacterales bacterium]
MYAKAKKTVTKIHPISHGNVGQMSPAQKEAWLIKMRKKAGYPALNEEQRKADNTTAVEIPLCL